MDQGQVSALKLDPNFVFPVGNLETARPAVHAKEFYDNDKPHPELYCFSVNPPESLEDFVNNFVENMMLKDPRIAMFAIFNKTGQQHITGNPVTPNTPLFWETPKLAGMISLVETNVVHQSTEIGYIMTFPKFQHTHVISNALGLLLLYCLELPAHLSKSEQKYGPGLGLRRIQWEANTLNTPSIRCAECMGFKKEGILRWHLVLLEGKPGTPPSAERETLRRGNGRHECVLSLCWDDWELEGGRELDQQQMDRF